MTADRPPRSETRSPVSHQSFDFPRWHNIAHHGPDGVAGVTEPISAWQCIGCGRIEAPQTCIGVCQDRRVELVYASDYAVVEAALEATRAELHAAQAARDEAQRRADETGGERQRLHALVHRLAFSRPRDGEWERSYRAFQGQARDYLLRVREAADGEGVDGAPTRDDSTKHAA